MFRTRRVFAALVFAIAAVASLGSASAQEPIKIGHVAALSGASAQSGEAITRGLQAAIEEINAAGGLLGGRPLQLIQRDDESKPPKGLVSARELIFNEGVAALFGGIDSPVSLAIVPLVNQERVPFMGVWAAATPITRNGANPNYVFRVSAVDALVDIKLLDYANKRFGAEKIGLMLINNPWGESNEHGLIAADQENDAVEIVGIEKFESNDVDMVPQLTRLKNAGAEAIIPGGQHTTRGADDEVPGAHGLGRAGGFALGHFRRSASPNSPDQRREMPILCRPTASLVSRGRSASD
jgi:branched-chain amino acid transport system substrate-binding protein